MYLKQLFNFQSLKLSEICENLVHNARDPLVIQPATLQIANLRKKPTEELVS
jgi:hypothetical protein